MKIIALVCLFLMASGCAGMKLNTVLMGTSTAALAVDWAQTRTIAQNPDKFHEHNPILGQHPSTTATDLYFAGMIAANIGLHWLLPEKYQPYWYGFITSVELGVIGSNFSVGIGF